MEQAINLALNLNKTTEQYEKQLTALQHQIDELQVQLSESGQWKQRAEQAEKQLQNHEQRRLTEQEIMELEGFRDNNDGTVTQLGTNLTWMRFSLGQHWVNGRVHGEAEVMPLREAKEQIDLLNKRMFLGRNSWRLPELNELRSLVKRSKKPTIDQTIFPGTKGSYWTNSKQHHVKYPSRYTVDFSSGESGCWDDGKKFVVRLISAQK